MPHLSVAAKNTDAVNAHYKACKSNGMPYVLCLRRRTKANVEFDHISLDSSVDTILEANEREIRDGAIAIFKKNFSSGATYDLGAKVMLMRDLPIENAERAAAELFQMLTDVIERRG